MTMVREQLVLRAQIFCDVPQTANAAVRPVDEFHHPLKISCLPILHRKARKMVKKHDLA